MANKKSTPAPASKSRGKEMVPNAKKQKPTILTPSAQPEQPVLEVVAAPTPVTATPVIEEKLPEVVVAAEPEAPVQEPGTTATTIPEEEEEVLAQHNDPYIQKLLKTLGIAKIPSTKEMFYAHKQDGCAHVSLADLALFCNPKTFTAPGEIGDSLEALASRMRAANILNPYAEINPHNVAKIGEQLLRGGTLHMPLTVVKISDPENIPEHLRHLYDPNKWQIASGRHRAAFFGLLYRLNVMVPALLRKVTYAQAQELAEVANQNRVVTPLEKLFLHGHHLTTTDADPKHQYRLLGGKRPNLISWVMRNAVFHQESALNHIKVDLITSRPRNAKSSEVIEWGKGLLAREFAAIIGEPLTAMIGIIGGSATNFTVAKPVLNQILKTIEAFYHEYNTLMLAHDGTPITGYFAPFIGAEIANQMRKHIPLETNYDPQKAGKSVAELAAKFMNWNDTYKVIRGMRGEAVESHWAKFTAETGHTQGVALLSE